MQGNLPQQFSEKSPLYHHCPVCGSEYGTILGCLKYDLFDDNLLANKFNVVCCIQCGFVFCNTASSQEEYNHFYENSFYSSSYLNRQLGHDEKKYFVQTAEILSSHIIDNNAAIFDIGSGTGLLLKTLHSLGYKQLYAIDLSTSCVNTLNKHNEIQAEIGSVIDIPFNNIKADVIILSHIMEHVINLPAALQHIYNKLSEGGLVYIEVPDATRYDTFKSTSPLRFFYFQHIIHFDLAHLHNLLGAYGYQEVKSGHRVRTEGELLMPCVWGIFRKDDSLSAVINPNFHLARQIQNWFKNSSLDKDNLLANLASSNTPVYIWGIGIHTQMMLAMSPLGYCNIKYFVDKDEKIQNKTIAGKKIYSPEVLYNATKLDTVIIGAPTHSKEMFQFLMKEIGFKGKVIIVSFGNVCLIPEKI